MLTAAEYHALAAELGLESDEAEQVAPYVASPVVGDESVRLAGETRSSNLILHLFFWLCVVRIMDTFGHL